MAYKLFEYTDDNQGRMIAIWESLWLKSGVDKQLGQLENDHFSRQHLSIFLRHLPKNGRILEGGCGLGQWVIYLRSKGYDIMGIDNAKETIERIKDYDNTIPVEEGDITNSRFLNDYFDAYISLGVVEHFIDGPFIPLQEARRILKRDGLLFISIPVFNSVRRLMAPLDNLYRFICENRHVRRIFGKRPYPKKNFIEYRYTIEQFEKILQREGFAITEKFSLLDSPINLFNYFLEPPSFLAKGRLLYNVSNKISIYIASLSSWIAPHTVLWICKNKKDRLRPEVIQI